MAKIRKISFKGTKKWVAKTFLPPHPFGEEFRFGTQIEKFDILFKKAREIPLEKRTTEKRHLNYNFLQIKNELLKLKQEGLLHGINKAGGLGKLKKLFELTEEELKTIENKVFKT